MDIYEILANEGAHLAFNGQGCLEPITEFNFDEIDRLLADAKVAFDEPTPDLADAFAEILDWCWQGPKNKNRHVRSASLKFATMSALLRPELAGNKSYKEIAAEFGVTKQRLSAIAQEFQERFGIHFRRSRREGACESMRQSRLKFYRRRKNEKPPV